MARVLPALIELGLLIYCLIDCIQTPDAEVRNLPKWAWIVLILLVPLAGGIAWLFVGRPSRRPGASATSGSSTWPLPGAGFGRGSTRSGAARGPDDDPDFLRGLGRGDAGGSAHPGDEGPGDPQEPWDSPDPRDPDGQEPPPVR